MRIGIVGAGLAGLACAWTLHRHGAEHGQRYEVVVLEARERVGGRVWSEELCDGVVVERGGEWIDADQHTIRRICAELRLPLAPHGVRFHRRRVAGSVPTLGRLEQTLAAVAAAVPEADATLADAFRTALGAGYAADPVFLRVATSTAGDPARASARFHLARAESGRIEGAARVVGGNQRIAVALAAELGDRLRTGTPVRGVAATADGVVLTTSTGERIEVDRAVVAVPLALLDGLAWEPGLPPAWAAAAELLATGTACKLSLPAAGAAPDGVQHPRQAWWAWNSLDPAGDTGVAAVTCFAGGPDARDQLAVPDGPRTWADAASALRPDLDLARDRPLLTDWATDPWSRGGYSHVLAGADRAKLDRLRHPQGPLVLAGEFTAGDDSGTMEGALASGVRAAEALL